MDAILLLRRIGASTEAKRVFENTSKPSERELNRIRVFLEELFWEYTIWFYPRDFLGYYHVDRVNRIIYGLWPASYNEAVFLLVYVATVVFDTPDEVSVMKWVRDTGSYSRHIDMSEWRDACACIEKLIQGSLVTQNSS
jgi:hypothetical protein